MTNTAKAPKSTKAKRSPYYKKTVRFTQSGICKLPEDKPVVYRILTAAKNLNYIGAAKKGEVQVTILKHLQPGKLRIPGHKVQIVRQDQIRNAWKEVKRLAEKQNPRYGSLGT